MIIKRIDCKSFAGINRVDVKLNKGMNVIVGDNESGKSTLTDFVYHVLFTEHNIHNKGEGADFRELSFPRKAEGSSPSTIEGSLAFEKDGKEYTVHKTWGNGRNAKAASCKLEQPDGAVNAEEAEEAIRSLLEFGAGAYRETVFSSQRHPKRMIELLLSGTDNIQDENLKDFSQALSSAALETRGIPYEKLVKKLDNTLSPYEKGWDLEKDAPTPKAVKEENAVIRPLYDELKSIESEMEGVEESENEYEKHKETIREYDLQRESLEKDLKKSREYSNMKKEKEESEEKASSIKEELKTAEAALSNWPVYKNQLAKARQYQLQLDEAKIVSQFNEVKERKEAYEDALRALQGMQKVEDSDISCLEQLQKKIEQEKSKLSGMNIDLEIAEMDESAVRFSFLEGEEVKAKANTSIAVDRAMNIEVSNKLKMQIKPRNIDTKEVQCEIEKAKHDFEKKCEAFSCETIERVKDLKEQYDRQEKKTSQAEETYKNVLNTYGLSWPELQEKRKGVVSELERDAVMVHVKALAKDLGRSEDELVQWIADFKTAIKSYEEKYESIDNLEKQVQRKKEELSGLEEKIERIIIPAEIEKLNEETIERDLETLKNQTEELRNGALTDARAKIIDKKPLATYRLEMEEKKFALEIEKREARRWNEIKKRLVAVKEETSQMDVTSLKESFTKYLQILTSGGVSINALSSTLELEVTSGNNLLNDKILSYGTREVIELAFRLSMLDELFPEGGGFAIFDDSLVNMDPDRTRRACEALREFAKKNQVIFVTCHPEYTKLLGVDDKEVISM